MPGLQRTSDQIDQCRNDPRAIDYSCLLLDEQRRKLEELHKMDIMMEKASASGVTLPSSVRIDDCPPAVKVHWQKAASTAGHCRAAFSTFSAPSAVPATRIDDCPPTVKVQKAASTAGRAAFSTFSAPSAVPTKPLEEKIRTVTNDNDSDSPNEGCAAYYSIHSAPSPVPAKPLEEDLHANDDDLVTEDVQ